MTARTLADAWIRTGFRSLPGDVSVPVKWRDDDGVQHRGNAMVPQGTPTGSEVRLSVDDTDAVLDIPSSHDVARSAAGTGLAALLGSWLTLGLLLLGVRWLLGRSRLRAWQSEWAQVEPRWTEGSR